ncbi:MAG: prepilin-type N-terminal cleavage/methylation domain-containing protein [Desulfobacterales bacterium]|nr:prepilin-type N-terminal cleavage/methylation domain-containing protein [Desulfobacterales bacterium]
MNVKLKARGFTLIELMIVISIIAILTATIRPNFAAYRNRAYISEAEVVLGLIASCEMRHKMRYGEFVACPLNPPRKGASWNSDMPQWKRIGFNGGGDGHFQYEVVTDETGFKAFARGGWCNIEISSMNLKPVVVKDSKSRK